MERNGAKRQRSVQVCSAFLELFVLPLWQFKMTRGVCEGEGGSFLSLPLGLSEQMLLL